MYGLPVPSGRVCSCLLSTLYNEKGSLSPGEAWKKLLTRLVNHSAVQKPSSYRAHRPEYKILVQRSDTKAKFQKGHCRPLVIFLNASSEIKLSDNLSVSRALGSSFPGLTGT